LNTSESRSEPDKVLERAEKVRSVRLVVGKSDVFSGIRKERHKIFYTK